MCCVITCIVSGLINSMIKYQVTILEASNRIGGRVYDEYPSNGCGIVRMGAMFVTGVINNPFTLLSKQLEDVQLIPIDEDHCDLLLERGVVTPYDMDRRVEENYNTTLDKLSEWRAGTRGDASLIG